MDENFFENKSILDKVNEAVDGLLTRLKSKIASSL